MPDVQYYIKFVQQIDSEKKYTEENFLEYLESLDKLDWDQLITDLVTDAIPPLMTASVRKDFSTLAYFAIYFAKVSERTKELIISCFIQKATQNLTLENKGASQLFSSLIELSRLLEWGLPSNFIIKSILMNEKIVPELKYNAAITLSFYTDLETKEFWENESGNAIRFNSYLSFPRFLYFLDFNLVQSLYSLQYFQKSEYIVEEDLRLPLEDFFYRVLDDDNLKKEVIRTYNGFEIWIKRFIEDVVLLSDEFLNIKSIFTQLHFSAHKKLIKLIDEKSTKPKDKSSFSIQNFPFTDLIEINNIKNYLNQKIQYNSIFISMDDFVPQNYAIHNFFYSNSHRYHLKDFNRNEFNMGNNEVTKSIIKGFDCFRESKINESIGFCRSAIETFYKQPNLDNLNIYNYGLVLQQLGDIYLVFNNFKKAEEMFIESYNVINNLEIPKFFLSAAQLKVFGIFSYYPRLNTNWDINLLQYIKNLNNQLNNLENRDDFKALLGDANFYLCNGYYRINEKNSFLHSFEQGISINEQNQDVLNSIRLYILYTLFYDSNKYFTLIKNLFNSLNEKEKNDPFITTLLSSLSNETKNQGSYHKIESLFESNNISLH
jgi:hypothetical protein